MKSVLTDRILTRPPLTFRLRGRLLDPCPSSAPAPSHSSSPTSRGRRALVQQLQGALARGALARTGASSASAFEAHGGDEVDTQGDSFFYVFGRARDAALARRGGAARAGRARVAGGRRDPHPDRHAHRRAGRLGGGLPRRRRPPGGADHGRRATAARCCSRRRLPRCCATRRSSGVGVRDLGVHRLKDLDRPEHVYQLVADGLEPDVPEDPHRRRGEAVLPAAARHRRGGRRARRRRRDPGVRPRRRLRRRRLSADGQRRGQRRRRRRRELRHAPRRRRPAWTSRTAPRPAPARSGSRAAAAASRRSTRRPHQVEQTIDVGAGPEGVAVNGNDVWVANSLDGTVSLVSARQPSRRWRTTRSATRRRASPSATARSG